VDVHCVGPVLGLCADGNGYIDSQPLSMRTGQLILFLILDTVAIYRIRPVILPVMVAVVVQLDRSYYRLNLH